MPAIWTRAILIIALTATGSFTGHSQTAPDPTSEISKAYAEMSDAWAVHNPEKAVLWADSTMTVIDQSGKSARLSRDQQLAAARFDMRELPGTKYFPRQTTVIQEVRLEGRNAHVSETTIKELSTVDANGTMAHIRFVIVSEDEWIRTAEGWRMSVYRIRSFQRSADGSPSPAIAGALRSMRATNNALRSFDAGINFSSCMNASQNQGIEYESRKAYCGPGR